MLFRERHPILRARHSPCPPLKPPSPRGQGSPADRVEKYHRCRLFVYDRTSLRGMGFPFQPNLVMSAFRFDLQPLFFPKRERMITITGDGF